MESWDAVRMAQPSWGHFDLGTGYHGDVWLDLDALLGDAGTVIPDQLAAPFHPAATLPSRTWPATEFSLCSEGIPFTAVPASPAGTM